MPDADERTAELFWGTQFQRGCSLNLIFMWDGVSHNTRTLPQGSRRDQEEGGGAGPSS